MPPRSATSTSAFTIFCLLLSGGAVMVLLVVGAFVRAGRLAPPNSAHSRPPLRASASSSSPDDSARFERLFGALQHSPVDPPASPPGTPCAFRCLVAVVDGERSVAIIRDATGQTTLLTEGVDAELFSVSADAVELSIGGERCMLTMFVDDPPGTLSTPATHGRASARVERAPRRSARDDAVFAPRLMQTSAPPPLRPRTPDVRRVSDHGLAQVRVLPSEQGWRLYGIRRDSLLARLGLQNGDRIEEVDGEPITSVDGALDLLLSLRTAPRLSLTFNRRGQRQTFDYAFH